MKHHEDLTRIHIKEAIQTGLKSQFAHRNQADQDEPVPPPGPEVPALVVQPSTGWKFRIRLIFQYILNPGK